MSKLCKKCGVEKPFSDFHNDSNRKDGKFPVCKECHYTYMRNRYATHPEVRQQRMDNHAKYRKQPGFLAAQKRRSENYYQGIKGRATSLLRNAQRSPDGCDLTLEWVIAGIERGYCQLTGYRFDLTNGHQKLSGRAKNPYAPSLDRINPNLGYTQVNTRVVIWQYNMMKGELTDNELHAICQQIIKWNLRYV